MVTFLVFRSRWSRPSPNSFGVWTKKVRIRRAPDERYIL